MSKTGVVSRGREREGRKARDRNGEGAPANLIFVREPIHVAKQQSEILREARLTARSRSAEEIRMKSTDWDRESKTCHARISPSLAKLLGPLSLSPSWNFQRRISKIDSWRNEK